MSHWVPSNIRHPSVLFRLFRPTNNLLKTRSPVIRTQYRVSISEKCGIGCWQEKCLLCTNAFEYEQLRFHNALKRVLGMKNVFVLQWVSICLLKIDLEIQNYGGREIGTSVWLDIQEIDLWLVNCKFNINPSLVRIQVLCESDEKRLNPPLSKSRHPRYRLDIL